MSNTNILDGKIYVAECDFGKGLFAAVNIPKGEKIIIFTGNFVSREEIWAQGILRGNPMQVDTNTYMVLEFPGVLINHACDPNSAIVSGNVLIALRDIEKDEQIFFDYSTTMSEGDLWRMECKCGASNCRKIVTDFDFLPRYLQAKYLELGIVQNFIARQYKKNATESEKQVKKP